MKKEIILFFLFVTVFCGDYRKPTRASRNCFVNILGEEKTKKLLQSLRKYHRSNGKATLLDYILDKRQDLKEVAKECLLKIRRRRLDKTADVIDEAFKNEMVNYYLKAILRDENVKNQLIEKLRTNEQVALKTCNNFLVSEEICKMVINKLVEKLKEKN